MGSAFRWEERGMRIPLGGLLLIVLSFSAAQTTYAQPPAESFVAEGNRFAQERQYDKAVDAFKQALRINPEQAGAQLGLGSAYHNMGRLADALGPLTAAVGLEPQNAVAHLNLGITLAALRRPEDAMIELNEAKRLNPQSARIHNEVGNVLHNSFAQMDGALAAYQEAARLDSSVPAVHHNIGLMLMRLGRFGQAIEPFSEALRLEPDYRNARYHLSHAYTQLGRYDEAIDSWTKFLELVPGGQEALHNRAWNYLYVGHQGAAAATDARSFLRTAGWRDRSSPFMVLVAHLGYRQSGAEARGILDEAASRLNTAAWPYPVVAYMRGELTADRLMEIAATNDQKTEAHTYVGMDLLLKGRVQDAREHFVWVRDYGNKRFIEYALALAELGRM
jgi:tetratricopeptide (TPR) repeat protein